MKISWKEQLLKILGFFFLLCAAGMLFFLWRQEKRSRTTTLLAIGQKAPLFSVKKVDGTLFDLAQQHGHPVLLEFWATWCQACVHSLANLEELEQKKKLKPWNRLQVLALEIEGEQKQNQLMQYQKKFLFPIGLGNAEVGKLYPSQGIPFLVLIDDKGTIKQVWQGFPSRLILEQALSQISTTPFLN